MMIVKDLNTVEPLNKTHIGIRCTVPSSKVVLTSEVNDIPDGSIPWYKGGPYFRGSFIRSSTVVTI